MLTTSTGCIVVGGGGGRGGGGGSGGGVGGGSGGGVVQGANVTFQWTFGGESCGQHPEIDHVKITIPGETLMNNGSFNCTTNSFAGIVLHDFLNGTYGFTVDALDQSGTVTYFTGSGNFTVSGQDITVTVDLTPVNTNSAHLSWTFPALTGIPMPTCTDVQINNVSYQIDNGQVQTVACANGSGSSVQQVGHLAPGQHTLAVTAYDANTCGLYAMSGTFTTFAGNDVPVPVPLDYAVGGAVVKWTIEDNTGTSVLSCQQALLTNVTVNFSLDGQNWVYPQGDTEACSTGGVQEAIYYCLPPGNYIVNVQGMGSGGMSYTSSTVNPPGVTVTAGSFPDQNSSPGPDIANVIVKAQ